MRDSKGKHMDKDNRVTIEEGIRNGDSCREIARSVGVSPSTVSREVKANRTVVERRRTPGAKLSVRCALYRGCERVGSACPGCGSAWVECRHCRTRSCIDSCPDFELAMCPETGSWPHVCPPSCRKRPHCTWPRVRYRAEEAQAAYEGRLRDSRSGIDLTEEELERLNSRVAPLVRRGQSFEAICATHGGELGVGVRTLYNYQEAGILETSNAELPRKAGLRPRKRAVPKRGRARVDRSGREWADFCALPIEERARAAETEFRKDPTDEKFAALADERTEDFKSPAGGLYPGLGPEGKGPLAEWLFPDEGARAAGDLTLLRESDAWALCYVSALGERTSWQLAVEQDLRRDDCLKALDALRQTYVFQRHPENIDLRAPTAHNAERFAGVEAVG